MPIGNGDIAAGAYVVEGGDLYLLLAKNDAFNYMGDLYKTGRVRIAIDPNPFRSGKAFRQTLDLPTGSIRIEADGVTLRIWADTNRPLYHIEVHSPRDLTLAARPEFWKRFDGAVPTSHNSTAKRLNQPLARSRLRTCGFSGMARFCGTSPSATTASIRTI